MPGRIVLFGATGYLGELTRRALAARGARPVLAARDAPRLEELAEELGRLETAVADADRPDTVRALRAGGDRGGRVVPRLDRRGAGGARPGCALVTAFGYDFVPGNLAGALALRDAGDSATRVDVGYFTPGRFATSGGTKASAAGVILEPGFAWRGGRLASEQRVRTSHPDTPASGRRGTRRYASVESSAATTTSSGLWRPEASKEPVSVTPGHSARTRTPVPRVSTSSAWLSDSTNALLAPETAIDGAGWKAAVEATLMIAPRPRASIPGSTAWASTTRWLRPIPA